MTPLHWFGDSLRNALLGIPLWSVKLFFIVSLTALLIWVLRLPREATQPPDGLKRWDEELKIGASAAIVIQIALYAIFG